MRTVAPATTRDLARRFVHSLVPIALAYVVAHYFSLLAYQGQAMAYLASDPLGDGSDLFGTAGQTVDYGVVSATGSGTSRSAALVVGHVAGLALAHDRALVVYDRVRDATLAVLDARRDGRLHEPRPVAALRLGAVALGLEQADVVHEPLRRELVDREAHALAPARSRSARRARVLEVLPLGPDAVGVPHAGQRRPVAEQEAHAPVMRRSERNRRARAGVSLAGSTLTASAGTSRPRSSSAPRMVWRSPGRCPRTWCRGR